VSRGSPTLPTPGRPPEGEGSDRSTGRRWIGREDLKIAPLSYRGGRAVCLLDYLIERI
jgi:hypothetical protein